MLKVEKKETSFDGEEENIQGPKPGSFYWLFGTTEVVPCYKAFSKGVSPQPVRSFPVTKHPEKSSFLSLLNEEENFEVSWRRG